MTKNFLQWMATNFETPDLPGVHKNYKIGPDGTLFKAKTEERELPPSEWGGDPSSPEYGLIGRRREVIVGWEPITSAQEATVVHKLTGEKFRLIFSPKLVAIYPVFEQEPRGNSVPPLTAPFEASPDFDQALVDQRIKEVLRGEANV